MSERIGRCRLRSIIRAKKLTQVKLGKMVGMTKQQVNNYVTGDAVMNLETARRFAKALEVPIDDLYEWIEE